MVRPLMLSSSSIAFATFATTFSTTSAFAPNNHGSTFTRVSKTAALFMSSGSDSEENSSSSSRRGFVSQSIAFALGTATAASGVVEFVEPANAVGPIKINIINPTYTAAPCPPSRPIPGEKAMKGMRGLCVTVKGDLDDFSPKDLDKVGVYGYVNDPVTAESVLANNPDGGTDAGQFAIIEGQVTPKTNKVEFEFVAAVPMEKDIAQYENGIGPLEFKSLRLISFPGGQQFGAIAPCEMNEFSEECEAWEEENGPYEKGDFIMKSNTRTKGR